MPEEPEQPAHKGVTTLTYYNPNLQENTRIYCAPTEEGDYKIKYQRRSDGTEEWSTFDVDFADERPRVTET